MTSLAVRVFYPLIIAKNEKSWDIKMVDYRFFSIRTVGEIINKQDKATENILKEMEGEKKY